MASRKRSKQRTVKSSLPWPAECVATAGPQSGRTGRPTSLQHRRDTPRRRGSSWSGLARMVPPAGLCLTWPQVPHDICSVCNHQGQLLESSSENASVNYEPLRLLSPRLVAVQATARLTSEAGHRSPRNRKVIRSRSWLVPSPVATICWRSKSASAASSGSV